MWIYRQRQGSWWKNDTLLYKDGYSGFGDHKNVPESQTLPGLGPIPQGAYLVGSVEEDDKKHGPYALHLLPLTGTQTFGRSGFMVHGDSIEHPGGASHGCIILPRSYREALATSPDKLLIVLSGR